MANIISETVAIVNSIIGIKTSLFGTMLASCQTLFRNSIFQEHRKHNTKLRYPHLFPGLYIYHDDVIKWKHFPRYWPFVRGIHRSPVNSSHKGQWRGALIFSLICARINGWVNNREAGDLRRHRSYHDVIVMIYTYKERGRESESERESIGKNCVVVFL